MLIFTFSGKGTVSKGIVEQWAGLPQFLASSLTTASPTLFPPALQLDNNEGITSMALAALTPSTGGAHETFLVVGTAAGLKYLPTDCTGDW